MNLTTRIGALGAVLALAVTLSACASQSDEPAAGVGPTSAATEPSAAPTDVEDTYNDADVEFTQNMVVHHEGAIAMADLAVAVASTPEVKALGQRISAAQGPEIALMQSSASS